MSASAARGNRLNEFAEETGIFGIHLLRTYVSSVEKAFWLIATLFFSICTGRDILNLTQAYLNEEMLTLVTAVTNKTIVFDPPPALAFMFAKSFLDLEANLRSDRLLAMLENSDEQHDIKPLVRRNLYLINEISKQERAAVLNFSWNSTLTKWPLDELPSDLRILFDFYRSKNVSMVDVKQTTGVLLCNELGLRVCDRRHFSNLNMEGLLLRASTDAVEFSSWNQSLVVEFTHSFVATVELRLAGGDSFLLPDNADAPIAVETKAPATTTISVRPIGVFDRAESSKHPCLAESRYECTTRCIGMIFFRCARCWPTMIPIRAAPNDSFAGCPASHVTDVLNLEPFFNVLAACRTRNSSGTPVLYALNEECDGECWTAPECRARTFAHSVKTVEAPTSENLTKSTIRLVVESFSFPLFVERQQMSWEDYLAAFGGSLGLYLGLSFATLLHLPVFCARHFCRAYRLRKKEVMPDFPIASVSMFALSDAVSSLHPQGDYEERIRALERRVESMSKWRPLFPATSSSQFLVQMAKYEAIYQKR